jgi:hypothetical protein
MQNKENTNIFLDLDETLIFSIYSSANSHDHNLDRYKKYNPVIAHDPYVTLIRPIANDIIQFCRELVGIDNVYILTAATYEYACDICRVAGFGISYDKIFSREDFHYDVPKFKNKNNILIDNETYEYHLEGERNKVKFLHNLPKNKFVEIRDFTLPSSVLVDSVGYLDKVQEMIIQAIKN